VLQSGVRRLVDKDPSKNFGGNFFVEHEASVDFAGSE
jgi:hypothetical protein